MRPASSPLSRRRFVASVTPGAKLLAAVDVASVGVIATTTLAAIVRPSPVANVVTGQACMAFRKPESALSS
jgi:hypothetical protein